MHRRGLAGEVYVSQHVVAASLLSWRAMLTHRCTPRVLWAADESLCERLREIERLSGISGLMGWDEQVMMPEGAADARNKQKAALAAVIYEKQTDPALGRLIRELQDDWAFYSSANRFELANVRDAARDYALQVGKSKEMAMREAELEGKGYSTWVKARKENDFASFKPVLEEIIALRKEVVKATRPNMNAYDGCIDMFERGMTVRTPRRRQIFWLFVDWSARSPCEFVCCRPSA